MDHPLINKHSTNNIKNKLSLIITPITTTYNTTIPILSNHKLTHTKKTLNKLKTIPNFQIDLNITKIQTIIKQIKYIIYNTTSKIIPTNQILYQLQNTTTTIKNLPLIYNSILNKKLTKKIKNLILNIKYNQNKIIIDHNTTIKLKQTLISDNTKTKLPTQTIVTQIKCPLNTTIRNALKITKTIEILKKKNPTNIHKLNLTLITHILIITKINKTIKINQKQTHTTLNTKKTLNMFKKIIKTQNKNHKITNNPKLLPNSKNILTINTKSNNIIIQLTTQKIKQTYINLNNKQTKINNTINPTTKIRILAPLKTNVTINNPILELTNNNPKQFKTTTKITKNSLLINNNPINIKPLILKTISNIKMNTKPTK